MVSVIIPTYKREENLERAIKSVLKQTYKKIEIIVVDDSPTYNKKINEIKTPKNIKLKYVFKGRPRGSPRARNEGIKKATGEYIAFLDDDDEWEPTKTERQVKLLDQFKHVKLSVTWILDKRFGQERINKTKDVLNHEDILNAFNCQSTSSYMFRASFLKDNKFDEALASAQEYELAIRASKEAPVITLPKPLTIQNKTEGQISENWGRKVKGMKQVYKKHKADFKKANPKNPFKVFAILWVFRLGHIFGNKIYNIITPFKAKQARAGKRILFVYRQNRSFVMRDLEILKKKYEVTSIFAKGIGMLKIPFKVRRNDIAFVWFASHHAFVTCLFTRLFKKKLIVVTGGYDVAGEKEIAYGLMNSRILKAMVKYTLKRTDKILAVSKFNNSEIQKHLGINDAEVIYNSVDESHFKPAGEKRNIVTTVGFINQENVVRKGFLTFIEAAKFLPSFNFVLIGKQDPESIKALKLQAPENVIFPGFVSDEELLKYYQSSKVYCQLSFYESYGMAPAEAMLCECIPVVTKKGALPEVVGDTGIFVEYGDPRGVARAISKATTKDGKKARGHVVKNFPKSYREEKLLKAVRSVG